MGDAHVERLCACIMCVCVCVCVCVRVDLPRVGDAHVERLVFLRAPAAVDSVSQGTLFPKLLISKVLMIEAFANALIIKTFEKK